MYKNDLKFNKNDFLLNIKVKYKSINLTCFIKKTVVVSPTLFKEILPYEAWTFTSTAFKVKLNSRARFRWTRIYLTL